MSVGNLKDSGNQGNNFPFQLKVLKGLQSVYNELQAINVDTTAIADVIAATGSVITASEFFTVSGVDVDTWDASVGFTSDAIQFTGSRAWAIQIADYNITPGTPTLTLQVSTDGSTWSSYKPASTNIDITDTANRVIFDDIMPFGYLRIVYVSGGSTGDFSVKIAK